MGMNYYNEWDKSAAAWLRELIAEGLIPAGDVDERSITDVHPSDLAGYTQAHFFCGIAGWPLALQLAGFPSGRPVWTGSPPCQPFSVAGKRAGTEDERHLWPVFFNLIRECRPELVFGEQVEAAIGHGWLDAVHDDLEGEGYAVGAVGLPACGAGAFHIRQRIFFVADRIGAGLEIRGEQSARAKRQAAERGGAVVRMEHPKSHGRNERRTEPGGRGVAGGCGDVRMGNSAGDRCEMRQPVHGQVRGEGFGEGCVAGGLGHTEGFGRDGRADDEDRRRRELAFAGTGKGVGGLADAHGRIASDGDLQRGGEHGQQPQDGGAPFWSDAIFTPRRDGKARPIPVERQILALAYGISASMGGCWNQSHSKRQVEKKEINNASSKKTGTTKALLGLQKPNDPESHEREIGGLGCLQETEVLRHNLYGLGLSRDESSERTEQSETIKETCEGEMRVLRNSGKSSRSPSGRESTEQHRGELEDTLRILSQAIASSAMAGEKPNPILQMLLRTCQEAGNVSEALSALQEIWESVRDGNAEEGTADRLRACVGRLLTFSSFPLTGKIEGRAALLKGAGNAIVPQVAAEFIRAFMSLEMEQAA